MAVHRAASAVVAVTVLLATSPAAATPDVEVFATTTAAAVEACPGATGTMKTVVDMSPPCFESCPALCDIVDGMLTQYLGASTDSEKEAVTTELKGQVCKDKEEFACFYGENKEKCQPIVDAGRAIIPTIPASRKELDAQCSKRPATSPKDEPAQDVQDTNTTDNETDENQTTTKENSDSAHSTGILAPVLVAVLASLARA